MQDQHHHAPDSYISEVQIENGRIKNTLPLEITVQPNQPTPYNLKRLRVPYSEYAGSHDTAGIKPTEELAGRPVPPDFSKPAERPPSEPEPEMGPLNQEIAPLEPAGPIAAISEEVRNAQEEFRQYSQEAQTIGSGYQGLLLEAEMGRLDEKPGKGKPKREIVAGADGPRQLEMRAYAQRMMNNVLKERYAMIERES